jgi:hypothetical protein
MLIAKLIWKLEGSIVNAETVFVHGDLKKEVYMNIPEGMQCNKDHLWACSKLKIILKKLISTLKLIGFKNSKSDPYLLFK